MFRFNGRCALDCHHAVRARQDTRSAGLHGVNLLAAAAGLSRPAAVLALPEVLAAARDGLPGPGLDWVVAGIREHLDATETQP